MNRTIRGWNPGGENISCFRPDRPWGPSSLLYKGYRAFTGGKAAGAWSYHPPHQGPRLKKEYSYTSTPPLNFIACSRLKFTVSKLREELAYTLNNEVVRQCLHFTVTLYRKF